MIDVSKIDIAKSSALVGLPDSDPRTPRILHRKVLTCQGCGANVSVSAETIQPSKQSAFERGQKLYVLCISCAKPFFVAVESGAGVGEYAGDDALSDMIDQIGRVRVDRISRN